MVTDYCNNHFVSKGMIADIAIHNTAKGNNPHAHIMLTMRPIDEKGIWQPKSKKEYDVDENGKRIKLPSGEYKSHKVNTCDWNSRANCEKWRQGWADIQNEYLEQNGREERACLRSFARQGKLEKPTIHEGPTIREMEARGIATEIGNYNREVRKYNSFIQSSVGQIRKLQEEIDVEVQGELDGSEIQRARFNSSMLDSRILKEGNPYKSIKDTYVIFIYKHDKFKLNQPKYHVERTVRERGKEVNDGSHIIYVNGAYKGKDKIGRLIEDFYCKRSVDMHYKELADGVRYYKETEEGRKVMCKEVRKYGDNRAKEVALNEKVFAVKNLMKNMKVTLEKAMDTLNYSGKDREMIAKIILK